MRPSRSFGWIHYWTTLRNSLRLMLAWTTKWSINGANKLPNKIASMIPSGNAGFTTRMSTAINPMRPPYQYLPALVMDAETGSVAMKIIPKAKPPTTKCQYHGTLNIGLVSEPMPLNSSDVRTIPRNTPNTMRQLAIPCTNKTAPPSKMAKVDTSPIEPGTLPMKASNQVKSEITWFAEANASTPPCAIMPSADAPVYPSAATQTASPEICAG